MRRTDDGSTTPYRVLVVDDSALMRKLISDLIGSSPELEVVGFARDSIEAVEMTERLKPHAITLDVEMPGKSGLDALPDLLAVAPGAAIIMLSAHTQAGADVTLTALERGAIDFFPKPDKNQLAQIRENRDVLVAKIVAAVQSKVPRRRALDRPSSHPGIGIKGLKADGRASDLDLPAVNASAYHFIVIGISTGGPQTLGNVLPLIQFPLPPMLIVQHMPATFTAVFAERLNRACTAFQVKEAEEGDKIIGGQVLIAPGGRHMEVKGTATSPRIGLSDGPAVSNHRPSIDVLFKSASRVFGSSAAAFLMTGMGRDGVDGCKEVLARGGVAFGQDEASSVVYGMNKVALQEEALSKQFAIDQFPALVKRYSSEK